MDNILFEPALEQIVKACVPITRTETIPVIECGGRILADDVYSPFPVPSFDRSPLDGFALRASDSTGASADHPVILSITETIMAGDVPKQSLRPGTCARIMTGAMLPEGADCVIRQEDTKSFQGKPGENIGYEAEQVHIFQPLRPYQNYCYAGEDMEQGSLAIAAGERLTCLHQAVLSSLGIAAVSVLERPRVALITTGSETVMPGSPLPKGKIYDSNYTLFTALLASFGHPAAYANHVTDSAEDCCACIRDAAAAGSDLIITTGGVSVGQKDIMHDVFKRLDAVRIFWRVQLKPGSPLLFGTYHSIPLLCLSGNPFAAYATFELFARPALSVLASDPSLNVKSAQAVLANGFDKESPVRRFLRGYLEDGTVFLPDTGRHASGMLHSALNCNCLADIPAGSGKLLPGENVHVLLFS